MMKIKTLITALLFAVSSFAQLVADGTVTPTGNTPGEFLITDLTYGGTPGYTISQCQISSNTLSYNTITPLQPIQGTAVVNLPEDGIYTYTFFAYDSITQAQSSSVSVTFTVVGIDTLANSNCQASFILFQDSINVNAGQYYAYNTTLASTGFTGTGSYFWDFGDGNTSTDQYPTHTFTSIGTFLICLTYTEPNSCVSTYCDSIMVTVKASGTSLNVLPEGTSLSLNENNLTQTVTNIYPNPTNGLFTVSFDAGKSTFKNLKIIDLTGTIVFSQEYLVSVGENKWLIDQSTLKSGIYFLHLKDVETNQKQVIRLIKK